MSEEVKVDEKEQAGKVAKQFEQNLQKLVALFKGESNLKGFSKVSNDDASTLMDEVFREEKRRSS